MQLRQMKQRRHDLCFGGPDAPDTLQGLPNLHTNDCPVGMLASPRGGPWRLSQTP